MILIHVPQITNRLSYTFDFIFKTILKVDLSLTTEEEEFRKHLGPKLSYGKRKIQDDSLHFRSADILFEKDLYQQTIEFERKDGNVTFFKVSGGELSFDPFACSFYLVSRYEEYLPHTRDRYGRFKAESSTAYKGDFIEKPVINEWAIQIKEILLKKFPDIDFPKIPYSFTSTIDIDNAYAFKYKGLFRKTASLFLLLVKLEFSKFINRILIHLGSKEDPFDTYEKQFKIHKQNNIRPIYFILIGDYGKYDTNLSHTNQQYIKLIKKLDEHAEVCLHPSYGSNKSEKQLAIEKARLEKIIGKPVTKSRQHYIKMDLPHTYRTLLKVGIKEDFSMGYATQAGYRASTCTPFYFFDIEEDKKTDLKVNPFVIMDTTLKKYLHIRSKDVIPYLQPLVSNIKELGGQFMFIFHNESLGGERVWKNWGDVYEKFIRMSMLK